MKEKRAEIANEDEISVLFLQFRAVMLRYIEEYSFVFCKLLLIKLLFHNNYSVKCTINHYK